MWDDAFRGGTSGESMANRSPLLTHLFYWLLPIISALQLWTACTAFTFARAGTPPDEMDWDTEKHSAVALVIAVAPIVIGVIITAFALFVYLWERAPEVRLRAFIWACLLFGAGFVDYDRRRPVTEGWILRGWATFVLAVLATGPPQKRSRRAVPTRLPGRLSEMCDRITAGWLPLKFFRIE